METKYKVAGGLLIVLAALTLIPRPGGKIAPVGYPSLCSFAPFSTLILAVPAAAVLHVGHRKEKKKKRKEEEESQNGLS